MTARPDAVRRYPLEWPLGWRRTPFTARRRAPFSRVRDVGGPGSSFRRSGPLSVFDATQRLEAELARLGARGATLSTDVELRLDGRPRSDREPADPGAAVYFAFRGRATVLACDAFTRVADNIAAIAGHVEALRRIERYGVGTIEQALAGYQALPADTAADWRAVFGLTDPVTLDALEAAYRRAARAAHPDVGGSDVAMARINRARDYARQELTGASA